MSERWRVVGQSQSGHCCFEATVVDGSRPIMRHGTPSRNDKGEAEYEPICECFTEAEAIQICAALNAVDTGQAEA